MVKVMLVGLHFGQFFHILIWSPCSGPSFGAGGGGGGGGLRLTGLLCPICRIMSNGVEALKEHMTKAHGIGQQVRIS
jgi:hypothetical protein